MKINVLGFTYDVVRGYVESHNAGCTDHIKKTIRIDSALDFDNTIETILHEILHCLEYAMNLDLNDKDVWCLSRGLFSVLEDPQNTDFWAALAGSDAIMEEEEGYVAFDPSEVLEMGSDCASDDSYFIDADSFETPDKYTRTGTGGT